MSHYSGLCLLDYDAPLSEAGDYTEKYEFIVELVEKYASPKLKRPERPSESLKVAYPTLTPTSYLTYTDILDQVPASAKFNVERAVSMENLPMNDDSGQSFGYAIYRKRTTINNGDVYKVLINLITTEI